MSQIATQRPPKKEVKIGEYIVTGKIGQGGIAEIYRAIQPSLNREVAIKILSKSLTDNEDIVRRFERESMVIAKLNHPNIVHVIDRGTTAGRYYFVMEYINGTSLRQVIDSDKISLRIKLESIIEICKGLDYAHKNDIIHRDIKQANILVDKQGNVLITDFGIAQIVGNTDGEQTSTSIVMGTVAYMSPEQKISSRDVDQTTDIYAVGVMIYEILCGKKPLGHFKAPSEINPDISKKFDQIVYKCM
ncbi:MAG: serine/threonine-protein kinase, partial [candidate division Zixibacteria bacterium]